MAPAYHFFLQFHPFFLFFLVDLALKIIELYKPFLSITIYKKGGAGGGMRWGFRQVQVSMSSQSWRIKTLLHHRLPSTGLEESSCTRNRIRSLHCISLFCSKTTSQQSRVYSALKGSSCWHQSILPCSKREMHSSQSVLFPYAAKGPEPHLILFPNPKITGHLLSALFKLLFLTFL